MPSESDLGRDELLGAIRRVHDRLRDRVLEACLAGRPEELSGEATRATGDYTYAIDRVGEEELIDLVATEIAVHTPVVVVGEGVAGGRVVLPVDTPESEAPWRLIVDPIDGTRGLMYQKRSAWILTGAARNDGPETDLAAIEVAVQTELPLVTQHQAAQLWTVAGGGAQAIRWDRLARESQPLRLQPSTATDLRHGYATVCRFFPGARDVLAEIDERLARQLFRVEELGEAIVFDDQYASTGGQMYGLAAGQDRFIADLRPLMREALARRGLPLGHCCHPYDLCTKLIAEEAGVEITGPTGRAVDCPLDTESNVAWVGYANRQLRERIEPVLRRILIDMDLIAD